MGLKLNTFESKYDSGSKSLNSCCGHCRSFNLKFERGGNERQESEGHHKQSEETEYKIHMTGLVILNANAGHVFPGVTHWFFY